RHCGCSDKTVGNVRRDLDDARSTDKTGAEIPQNDRSVTSGTQSAIRTQPSSSADFFGDDDEPEDPDGEDLTGEPGEDPLLAQHRAPYLRIVNTLAAVSREIAQMAGDLETGGHLRLSVTRFDEYLQTLRGGLRMATPEAWCEDCEGEGCRRCNQTGFLTVGQVQARKGT
ncbi:MAG: hypothetical protein ACRCU1_19120, partial [Alsobacter sp.]